MRPNSKYRKKFAKQLLNGLRKDGMIVEEVCQDWGISPKTYYLWKKEIPEFAEAAEVGDRDYKCWWAKRYRAAATGVEPGNAAMLNMAAKNYLGMVDKQEIEHKHDEQITTIRIERIEAPKARIIEHERTESLPDSEPS